MFFPMAEAELSDTEIKLLHTRFIEEASGSDTKKLIAENLDRLEEMEERICSFYESNDTEN